MALHLRIFRPQDAEPDTLVDLFRDRILPARRGQWDPKTVAEYWATVNVWTEVMGNPAIEAVDDAALSLFVERLAERPGRGGKISPNTVRKHLRHLRTLFRELGPRRNGRGLGILSEIPWCPMPRPRRQPPTILTPEQLARMERAADAFQPDGMTGPVPAAQWWRALLRLLWNTALRIGTALALRWEWLDGDGWVMVPAEAFKGKRSGRRIYLNSALRGHLQALPHRTGPILPWSGNILTLHRWRARVQQAAGVPADAKHGFHAIRRAALSTVARINPLAARVVAGHSQGDVLLEYYLSDQVIAAALEAMPQF